MKKRLDMLMMERALAPSREKAKAFIMAGDVYVVVNTFYMAFQNLHIDNVAQPVFLSVL